MADVSGNDKELNTSESVEESETVDSESSEEVENGTETTSETILLDSPDYSPYFENLQTIGLVIIALLIAIGLTNAFIKGFNHK